MRENIFYYFGFPRELVTDQGAQFTSNLIEGIMEQHHIKHINLTPYNSQENVWVGVKNRDLERILTKVVNSSKKDWVAKLVEATWAYNTTWKATTRFTPFELFNGKKELFSI